MNLKKILITTLGISFSLVFFLAVSSTVEAAATLSLSPSSTTSTVGQSFSVAILLNTGGSDTVGTDVKLNFDAARLEVVSLTNGAIYPTYPSGGKVYDNAAGTIRWSGSASSPETFFSGSGTFGTINFRAKAAGTALVAFEYISGSTTDTNVVEAGTLAELLTSQPSGGTYTISSSAGAPTPTPTPTSGGASSPTPASGGVGGPSTGNGTTATDGASLETAFSFPTIVLLLVSIILLGFGGLSWAAH